jgi:hypothetical protein
VAQGTVAHGDELQALTDVHVLLKPFRVGEVEELVARLLVRGATPTGPPPEPVPSAEVGGPVISRRAEDARGRWSRLPPSSRR